MKTALIPVLLLAACGPIPVADAEQLCLDRARLAQQPRGQVAVGVTSDGGAASRIELDISTDYLTGRDPAVVFENCVVARSGQLPTRPLYQMPGYKS
ncbi:hypothetical protein EI545_06935 [Tabrizicola piscis]|jgi:hypothetical protein|uniref:Lipoprotein n=1 Tax=Tabrizicola piscis TaxID=2494374 RepID=A0A3S8U4N2_9RHOB|nr:hypothetical protein [Tabrizicola piscis]AZL58592.1 hypothetical protein EI545_06935 [Tabrizicola piscis]